MKPYQFPFFLLPTLIVQETVQAGQEVDDASRLNATVVSEIIDVRTEGDVKLALVKAHIVKSHISIAGKRHTMGGHTFDKDNILLNMLPYHQMTYEASTGLLTVQSGASWFQVQQFLDPLKRSVWVMQSDNIFSVGGTLSANAHGWQPRQGPISSTVESFRLMLATGEVKTCSRSENAPLFHAALGGYGMLGVILDVRLHTVPNKLYREDAYFFPANDYGSMFQKHVVENPRVELVYGRLSIDQNHFLTEAGLHVFEAVDPQPQGLAAMQDESMVSLKDSIFRKSAKSDAGKRSRWAMEKNLSRYHDGSLITRNTVMNPDFRVTWHPLPSSRDILQEYFVPYDRVNEFVESLKINVPKYGLNLLNVTLRDVKKDDDSVLAYAKSDVCALVLFFSQSLTKEAEEAMRSFASESVEHALALGGSFYLPYRLHYSTEQFLQAYPNAARFRDIKRQYDPDEIFTSQFLHHIFPNRRNT